MVQKRWGLSAELTFRIAPKASEGSKTEVAMMDLVDRPLSIMTKKEIEDRTNRFLRALRS